MEKFMAMLNVIIAFFIMSFIMLPVIAVAAIIDIIFDRVEEDSLASAIMDLILSRIEAYKKN